MKLYTAINEYPNGKGSRPCTVEFDADERALMMEAIENPAIIHVFEIDTESWVTNDILKDLAIEYLQSGHELPHLREIAGEPCPIMECVSNEGCEALTHSSQYAA